MMKQILRPTLSTALVVFFTFILIFLSLFAEVFESKTPEVDLAQIYSNPVPISELKQLKSFKVTNKQGTFRFENTHSEGNLDGPWQMTEPQALKVRGSVIPKLIEALGAIRVRNFHRLEPINITSFSLDNPTLTLQFETLKNKTLEIKVGLINPIDNSAYLSLSTENQIYQIDPLEVAIESFDLAQFVESKVLAINPESINSLEILGIKDQEFKIVRKDQQWMDQTGQILNESKVLQFFLRLEDIKSFSILNNLTQPQQKFLEEMFSAPTFTLKVISTQGIRTYLIAEVKGNIPGMTLSRNNLFALTTDEKKSFILLEPEQVKVFQARSGDLK